MTDELSTPAAMQAMQRDPAIAWLEDTIIANTPHWAHLLAQMVQYRGLYWLRFILPLIRFLTDVTVKTETNVTRPDKGFRAESAIEKRTLRVYKRGRMVAEKTFTATITKSPYSKIL